MDAESEARSAPRAARRHSIAADELALALRTSASQAVEAVGGGDSGIQHKFTYGRLSDLSRLTDHYFLTLAGPDV